MRTKNIYPRDRDVVRRTGRREKRAPFRFPVIPDQEKPAREEKMPPTPFEAYRHLHADGLTEERRVPAEEPISHKPVADVAAEEPASHRPMPRTAEEGAERKAFTLTEFVSPVYGKISTPPVPERRPQREEPPSSREEQRDPHAFVREEQRDPRASATPARAEAAPLEAFAGLPRLESVPTGGARTDWTGRLEDPDETAADRVDQTGAPDRTAWDEAQRAEPPAAAAVPADAYEPSAQPPVPADDAYAPSAQPPVPSAGPAFPEEPLPAAGASFVDSPGTEEIEEGAVCAEPVSLAATLDQAAKAVAQQAASTEQAASVAAWDPPKCEPDRLDCAGGSESRPASEPLCGDETAGDADARTAPGEEEARPEPAAARIESVPSVRQAGPEPAVPPAPEEPASEPAVRQNASVPAIEEAGWGSTGTASPAGGTDAAAPGLPARPAAELEPGPNEPRPVVPYEHPPLSLLNLSPPPAEDDEAFTLEQKRLLEETLANFHVNAQVVGIVKGPTVTRFEVQPAPGVKVNKITSLSDDIKLNLSAKDIRIEAPIPGRNAVGIEVPNRTSEPIFISRIIGSEAFQRHPSPLAVALGMDIGGQPIVADIRKMPHGLIAGATGSGKSVCINSIIVSLLYKATPEQVRLLLIDPKMVELAPYNHLPHLVTPVVTDAKQATAALKWAVEEMEKRYALFVDAGVRDVERYNLVAEDSLPYIVIVIDELADLMMVAPQDVEDCIIRIAQKARACGIHLLLATQRPSVDVITGNIKANVPTRLAFAVFSQVDSRTILDQTGAERLLGRGDMLFLESGAVPIRLQGNYVSDDEIERVTAMIKRQRKPSYLFTREELEQSMQSYDMGEDPLFWEALVFVAEQGQASASALQRRFRIGYNRAARLIEMMEAEGYVAGQSGGKPRAVLITAEDALALAEGTALL